MVGTGDKGKQLKDVKETSRDSDEISVPAPPVSSTDESKPADQPAPISRAASVSKPIPKPRPRSLIVEHDTNKKPTVSDTTERPIAPPRAKSKPPRGDSEAGAQENRAVKATKPKPPQRPDLNPPPPVKPKPKPVRSEPPAEFKVSPPLTGNEANKETASNASNEDIVNSNAQNTQMGLEKIEGLSEVGSAVGETKKAGPPPIPRRVDLE